MNVTLPEPTPRSVRERRDRFLAATRLLEHHSEPPDGDLNDWLVDLHQALAVVDEMLAVHIAQTEAEQGFLDELVGESAGRLQASVNELRADHGRLHKATRELLSQVEEEPHPEALRAAARDLVQQLDDHYRRGADLLWEAYGVDLGTPG
ncbi:MAG: hypothetical protein R3320_12465 [Nitriliruptorales bacterium]|nr:hypothetical protein [Nitriliruptorales bacterium]